MILKLVASTFLITLIILTGCKLKPNAETETIVKIEMNLSAMGVESDDYPSIKAILDVENGTNVCVRSYYHPDYKGSTYSLSKSEMKDILNLLNISDVQKLKPKYSVTMSDQPTSTTVIYTTRTKYVIEDYGLKGEFPLRDLYKIVYKFER